MREWIESSDSKLSSKKHRAVLNIAIFVLSTLILSLVAYQSYVLSQSATRVAATSELNGLQTPEDALFELDHLLARGNIFNEFAAAYVISDFAQADIIRSRLTLGAPVIAWRDHAGLSTGDNE